MILLVLLAALSSCSSLIEEPQTIRVGEFELEYEVAGGGDRTILLEAGGGGGLEDWDSVFPRMARHATVIRYARVGNGNSSKTDRHFSSADYAAHARRFLTELGVEEPVVLVAHSYGGSVARDFCAAYPERVQALLMLDPASEHDVDIMRAIDLERANREIAFVKLDDAARGIQGQYLDFWSKRPLPDYPEIHDMPVTVIVSIKRVEDPPNLFFTDEGRRRWGELWQDWAGAFPQGRARLTEKSGHHVQFDEPDLVLAELLLLLEKLAERRPRS